MTSAACPRAFVLVAAALALPALAAGCLKVDLKDGFPCSGDGRCPSPYRCMMGGCYRETPQAPPGSGGTGGGSGGSGSGGTVDAGGGATGADAASGMGGAGGTGVGGAGGAPACDMCTVGATQCQSGSSLQTCGVVNVGCTAFTTSRCSTPLVCERYPTAGCVDPNWALWVMPNGQADVTAGAPSASLESYTDNGDGTVTDKVTGLMWQKAIGSLPGDAGVITTFTWVNALAYCPTLTLGGHTDWRLPAVIELASLTDQGADPTGPEINTTFFPNLPTSAFFWSSTPLAGSSSAAWYVFFNNGLTENGPGTSPHYVRCVR